MATSTALTSDHPLGARVSVATNRACVSAAAAPIKAGTLRALAAWYRAVAARAANPALSESRLLTAEHLEVEGRRIDPQQTDRQTAIWGEGQPMSPVVNKAAPVSDWITVFPTRRGPIELLENVRAQVSLLRHGADYYLVRATMVIIFFFFFGYPKWFGSELQRLLPFIGNGPLIFGFYPAFRQRGVTLFLGVSEWTFAMGFWSKSAGMIGVLGSTGACVATVTIIPFTPEGWNTASGSFPAMTGNVPFLMKDVVIPAVSFYPLKQVVQRSLLACAVSETVRS